MNRPSLKAKVLIVDDDEDFCLALKPHLARSFEEVDHALDEPGALALLERKCYDLVILDIILGDTPAGLDLCRRIKAHERWRDIPVMVLSCVDIRYGMSIKSCLADAGCLPAEDFVDKEVGPEEVVERARRIVERPEGWK